MERNVTPGRNLPVTHVRPIPARTSWVAIVFKSIAFIILAIIALRAMVLGMNFYMRSWFFGQIFTSIRNTWMPDELTQALAVLITGIAMLVLPALALRILFGFSFDGNPVSRFLRKLGFRPRFKESMLVATVLWSGWISFSYLMSIPRPGELFSPFTTSARFKYLKDGQGKIYIYPLSYIVDPYSGEELKTIDRETAKEYQQQQNPPPEPPLKVVVAPVVTEVVKDLGVDKPCVVFTGGSNGYTLATSGSGLRLWIRKVEFFRHKTIINHVVEPGAAADELRVGGRLLASGKYSGLFQDWSTDEYGRKQIREPYEFQRVFGPVTTRGPVVLQSNGFEDFSFPIDYEGCPKQPPPPVVSTATSVPAPATKVPAEQSWVNAPDTAKVVFVPRTEPSPNPAGQDDAVLVPQDDVAIMDGKGAVMFCTLYEPSQPEEKTDSRGRSVWIKSVTVEKGQILAEIVVRKPVQTIFYAARKGEPPPSFPVDSDGWLVVEDQATGQQKSYALGSAVLEDVPEDSDYRTPRIVKASFGPKVSRIDRFRLVYGKLVFSWTTVAGKACNP